MRKRMDKGGKNAGKGVPRPHAGKYSYLMDGVTVTQFLHSSCHPTNGVKIVNG